MTHPAPSIPAPTALRRFARALRRRCPECGRGRMFLGWFTLASRCPACGLSFERDEREDYWLGAYLLNFMATEVLFAVLVLVVLVATWPEPAWSLLTWLGAAQMIVTPIVFYPFSKALWLAGDLVFRPPNAGDFAPDAPAGDGPGS
jgi:uncharacterized protein (DUF983 family)